MILVQILSNYDVERIEKVNGPVGILTLESNDTKPILNIEIYGKI